MRDLRTGVKLKKVQERQYNPLPTEFQLTPYEMLMDDIRAKRYTLRKVMVSRIDPEGFTEGRSSKSKIRLQGAFQAWLGTEMAKTL